MLFANIDAFERDLSPLLNGTPGTRFISRVGRAILGGSVVMNVRSLVVRSCNPNEYFVSLRTRIPYSRGVLRTRSTVSLARGRLRGECGYFTAVRVSPVTSGSAFAGRLGVGIRRNLYRLGPRCSVRSFEVMGNDARAGIIFSVIVPCKLSLARERVGRDTVRGVGSVSRGLCPVVGIRGSLSSWGFVVRGENRQFLTSSLILCVFSSLLGVIYSDMMIDCSICYFTG